MSNSPLRVRPYVAADEDAAIELWQRSWQDAYPDIDFGARVNWWRERWRNELVPQAKIVVAEMDGVLEGFVTVDPKSGYLDQIVVAPEFWGSNVATMLLDAPYTGSTTTTARYWLRQFDYPLAADVLHLIAAAAWVGAVIVTIIDAVFVMLPLPAVIVTL